ncbi:acetate--CoA ligase family protein [Chloroflexota bacterium]
MSTHALEEIFNPQSIAVIGARGSGAQGYDLYSSLLDYGYKGKIYPVNPKYSELLGIKAYPSLGEIPDSVDYVISCVSASGVLGILADCSQKGVKCVHIYAARFSETGRQEATELEQEILKKARKSGVRLIGPNCRGIYNPRQGISFYNTLPKESGPVGLASQTGGGAREIIRLASLRGIHFSKAVSYGNALDLNECDFLDYLSQDLETKIIMMYIEGVKDGKRFFNVLRQAASTKPVIIIKGGRGKSGARAVASHTASLTGSMEMWKTLVAQAGAISAKNFDEMVDLAVSFHFLPPITGARVGIAPGGGGGRSVLAADQCEEAGLDVITLPTEIREELKSKGISTWDWIGNPIDVSQTIQDVSFSTGDMLQMMARNQNFDLLIAIIGEPPRKDQQEMSAETHLKQYKKLEESKLKPLLAVVADTGPDIDNYDDWSWNLMREVRTELRAANIPIYPTIGRAARAARKLIDYYQKRDSKLDS